MRWERVRQQQLQVGQDSSSSGPGKRRGHTCNAIKGGSFLYVFGGYGKDNCLTNQVHVFDSEKQIWTQPMINGTPPSPRDSHTCTTIGDNLFVFGGTDGTKSLNDLHILDTSSHTWICPSVRGEEPEAREGHSATLVGKRLFVFGGCGKSSDTNDLYILNTENFVWKRAVTFGTPPSARDSHTCSSWNNKIFVIGGEDGHGYYLSDVHILDTDTLRWKEMNTSGQILTPRAGHVTVSLGRNIFVFGGFTDAQNLYNDLYVLDVDTSVWSKVLTVGEGPSARFSSAGACLDPHKAGFLIFFGGCNKILDSLDDMFYLHTGLGSMRLKKQMKLKCQEQSQTGRVTLDLNTGQNHQEKRMFQARVTKELPIGYSIETVIDGIVLHGIVFSTKQNADLQSTKWGFREMTNLAAGVKKYGKKWKKIKEDSVFGPILGNWTAMALKDKWRTKSMEELVSGKTVPPPQIPRKEMCEKIMEAIIFLSLGTKKINHTAICDQLKEKYGKDLNVEREKRRISSCLDEISKEGKVIGTKDGKETFYKLT